MSRRFILPPRSAISFFNFRVTTGIDVTRARRCFKLAKILKFRSARMFRMTKCAKDPEFAAKFYGSGLLKFQSSCISHTCPGVPNRRALKFRSFQALESVTNARLENLRCSGFKMLELQNTQPLQNTAGLAVSQRWNTASLKIRSSFTPPPTI